MAITAEDLKKISPRMLALLLAVVFLLLGYFYWFFLFQAAWEKRTALQTKTEELAQQIADKERIAAQKDKYLKEVAVLKEAFVIALTPGARIDLSLGALAALLPPARRSDPQVQQLLAELAGWPGTVILSIAMACLCSDSKRRWLPVL